MLTQLQRVTKRETHMQHIYTNQCNQEDCLKSKEIIYKQSRMNNGRTRKRIIWNRCKHNEDVYKQATWDQSDHSQTFETGRHIETSFKILKNTYKRWNTQENELNSIEHFNLERDWRTHKKHNLNYTTHRWRQRHRKPFGLNSNMNSIRAKHKSVNTQFQIMQHNNTLIRMWKTSQPKSDALNLDIWQHDKTYNYTYLNIDRNS